MSSSVNKVILIGHLGRDPETRQFANGGSVCSLRIATSETWKDNATGERRQRTEWHRTEIRNAALARVAQDYLRKGSKVYIEGQLETRRWQDQSGQERFTTEVVLRTFNSTLTLLDRPPANGQAQGRRGNANGNGNADNRQRHPSPAEDGNQPANAAAEAPKDASEPADDDIPF